MEWEEVERVLRRRRAGVKKSGKESEDDIADEDEEMGDADEEVMIEELDTNRASHARASEADTDGDQQMGDAPPESIVSLANSYPGSSCSADEEYSFPSSDSGDSLCEAIHERADILDSIASLKAELKLWKGLVPKGVQQGQIENVIGRLREKIHQLEQQQASTSASVADKKLQRRTRSQQFESKKPMLASVEDWAETYPHYAAWASRIRNAEGRGNRREGLGWSEEDESDGDNRENNEGEAVEEDEMALDGEDSGKERTKKSVRRKDGRERRRKRLGKGTGSKRKFTAAVAEGGKESTMGADSDGLSNTPKRALGHQRKPNDGAVEGSKMARPRGRPCLTAEERQQRKAQRKVNTGRTWGKTREEVMTTEDESSIVEVELDDGSLDGDEEEAQKCDMGREENAIKNMGAVGSRASRRKRREVKRFEGMVSTVEVLKEELLLAESGEEEDEGGRGDDEDDGLNEDEDEDEEDRRWGSEGE
ncbi:hypothetical protein BDZ91DRAFT_709141 [Kalaharituber pfeilii]|nr:hypothetical protein BDZ91DRAFT_709141 [Kalaharituber pfeilii]